MIWGIDPRESKDFRLGQCEDIDVVAGVEWSATAPNMELEGWGIGNWVVCWGGRMAVCFSGFDVIERLRCLPWCGT